MTAGLMALALWLVINVVWLLFLSDLVSKVAFKADPPLPRAIKSVVFATALSWVIAVAVIAYLDLGRAFFQANPFNIAIWIGAPVITFLWEWRSFQRHWTDEDALADVFD